MARVELDVTSNVISRSGLTATYGAFDETDGNYFDNAGQRIFLHVKNADSANHIIHVYTQSTRDGKAVKDLLVTVANGTEKFIGPFTNADYGTSGLVWVDCYDASGPTFDNATDAVSSGTLDSTSVTVAAIELGSL